MQGRYLSLLILAIVCQSVVCGFNSASASNPAIKDLSPLSKIATTLGDTLNVVGIVHETAHSAVLAGNFVKEVKFLDGKYLTPGTTSTGNGFIVAYDRAESVRAMTVINDVSITKLSNDSAKYYVSGVALVEGSWCGAPNVPKDSTFSAVFERNDDKFECKSVTHSLCPAAVFANEAYATFCDADKITIVLGPSPITANYKPGDTGQSLTLRHLIKTTTGYVLVGEYKGKAKIDSVQLTSDNGLFALLIKDNVVKNVFEVATGAQKFAADFVRVIGERVIVAATGEGNNTDIGLTETRKVKLSGKGVLLFDLVVTPSLPDSTPLVNTWGGAYPLPGDIVLRDVTAWNKYVFLAHDQPELSVPFSSTRNVAVSVLDLESANKYSFVHSVNEDDLRAGAVAVDSDGTLLLTGLNYNRGALELMYSETALPAEMTRPVEQPTRPVSAPVPVPVAVPVAVPTVPPSPPVAPVVPVAPPVAPIVPVAPPVAPIAPLAPPKADQVPVAEPKPEVVKDNTSTFSSSWVIIAVVVLTVFLVYFGLRFWRQYRAERQRQYGRVRMEDRIREDDFYNP